VPAAPHASGVTKGNKVMTPQARDVSCELICCDTAPLRLDRAANGPDRSRVLAIPRADLRQLDKQAPVDQADA